MSARRRALRGLPAAHASLADLGLQDERAHVGQPARAVGAPARAIPMAAGVARVVGWLGMIAARSARKSTDPERRP